MTSSGGGDGYDDWLSESRCYEDYVADGTIAQSHDELAAPAGSDASLDGGSKVGGVHFINFSLSATFQLSTLMFRGHRIWAT